MTELYRNPSGRIPSDCLSDPIVRSDASKRVFSSIAKTTARKIWNIWQILIDLSDGIQCESVTRNPVGFCRIIGSYKIRQDPTSDWCTWVTTNCYWIFHLNNIWMVAGNFIKLNFLILILINLIHFQIQFIQHFVISKMVLYLSLIYLIKHRFKK